MGLFDFLKKKKAVLNDIELEDVLLFDKLDRQIEKYNRAEDSAKWSLYEEIYSQIVELEALGVIVREKNKKPISYLQQILDNDGPEFCYVIEFCPIWDKKRKYEIGVCVRGDPIIKKIK